MHKLNVYLGESPEFSSWRPPYGWGVYFSGVIVRTGRLDSSLPGDYVIDKSGLIEIKAEVESVSEANSMSDGLIPPSKIQAFLKVTFPR